MKKLILLSSIFILSSCESSKDVQEDINRLRSERQTIESQLNNSREILHRYRYEIDNIDLKKKETEEAINKLEMLQSGNARYVIKVKCKQSRFSLDIGEHIKDGMNAFEFELPVDSKFYNQVNVGTEIVDDFRTGSLILNGSFSSMTMKVISKRIERGK